MGTQSARAMLVDATGAILFKAQKNYEQPYYSQKPGWAEQKPEFYWESLCEVSRALKEKSGDAWGHAAAVSCTCIRDTCLCLGESGEPLRDAILWIDDRKAESVTPLPPRLALLLRLAGMGDGIKLLRQASHCNWLASEESALWRRTKKFVFLSAWLNFKLCGALIDSNASVIGHLPFNYRRRAWMKKTDMRRVLWEVASEMQCELAEPATVIGSITAAAAKQTGIAAGLPLVATGSDKGCETLGLSCMDESSAALSFGTTATVQLATKKYFEPAPFMPAYPAVVPGLYNPEVEIYRGYWLLSWFKREFASKEVADAARLGVSAEQLLDERLSEIPPGCDGLVLQPYFTPGLTMPWAKGAAIGFSDGHTRIHLYRAIIEGINFALMEGLRTMEKRGGIKAKKIFVAGGGGKSDEVCRITANMFGLPLYRIQTHEAAGIGSSLAAFKALGHFASFEEGVAAMVHIKDEFIPDEKIHALYENLYQKIFTKIFGKLSPLYQESAGIIKHHRNQNQGEK
jgi:sugar (pentulose or hexulose) kinase